MKKKLTILITLLSFSFYYSQTDYDYYKFQNFQTFKWNNEQQKYVGKEVLEIESVLNVYKTLLVVSFKNTNANYSNNEPLITSYDVLKIVEDNENEITTYVTKSRDHNIITEFAFPKNKKSVILAKDCEDYNKCKTFTILTN